jgi:hypothetical protein
MDLTLDFQQEILRIAKLRNLKVDIFSKPKLRHSWLKAAKDLNQELFELLKYLKWIQNPYLGIREYVEQTNWTRFPRPADIIVMTQKERNDLDLQLIQFLNLLDQKRILLFKSIPNDILSIGESIANLIGDQFQSIRDFHKSIQRKRTEKESFKQRFYSLK